jgi:hypothetical protein
VGKIRGQSEYEKFQKGEPLSRRGALLANCYMCNGLEESNEDCRSKGCPIYSFQPYRGVAKSIQEKSAILEVKNGGFSKDVHGTQS